MILTHNSGNLESPTNRFDNEMDDASTWQQSRKGKKIRIRKAGEGEKHISINHETQLLRFSEFPANENQSEFSSLDAPANLQSCPATTLKLQLRPRDEHGNDEELMSWDAAATLNATKNKTLT